MTFEIRDGKMWLSTTTYIENPQFIDYHDGAGIQLCGGTTYSWDGKPLGHIDPPGPRGMKGEVGDRCQEKNLTTGIQCDRKAGHTGPHDGRNEKHLVAWV
jgi:hypothetical protein